MAPSRWQIIKSKTSKWQSKDEGRTAPEGELQELEALAVQVQREGLVDAPACIEVRIQSNTAPDPCF